MSEARINRISNEKGDGGPSLSGITTFSGLNYFVPPKGTTAERPSDCPPGSIRFNTDSAHLEYWDGLQWLEFEATSEELGGGTGSNTGLGTRVLVGGLGTPAYVNTIEYYTISTLGNSQDFGDLTGDRGNGVGACASSTRGLFLSGYPNTTQGNIIDFVTFSSTGNATDFGDTIHLSEGRRAVSNQTRGVSFGGRDRANSTYYNLMDYITIASTGDAQDFGDLSADIDVFNYAGAFSSPIRGVLGGSGNIPNATNVINYFTISTQGNTQDFGDLTYTSVNGVGGMSNPTRGIFASGGSPTNVDIAFITISTTGNAQDFGDMVTGNSYAMGGASPTRGLLAAGGGGNATQYINIPTTGNAVVFGDLWSAASDAQMPTNGHGGL